MCAKTDGVILSAGIDTRWRRKAITSLKLTGRERVLDLCTGTADLAMAYWRASKTVRIVGTDFCHPMLAGAKKLSSGCGIRDGIFR